MKVKDNKNKEKIDVKLKTVFIPFSTKDRRILWYTKKIGGVQTLIRKRKISSNTISVGYRKQSFTLDIGKPAIRVKNRFIYIVDLDSGQQVFEADNQKLISPEIIDAIMVRQIGKQLVSGLESSALGWNNIILLILGIVCGVALGYIIGNFVPFPISPEQTGGIP